MATYASPVLSCACGRAAADTLEWPFLDAVPVGVCSHERATNLGTDDNRAPQNALANAKEALAASIHIAVASLLCDPESISLALYKEGVRTCLVCCAVRRTRSRTI